MIAIMAITIFFGQIVPNLMGDAIRAWFLVRLGRNWRQGLESVIIDRGVGIAAMLIIGSVTLLFPSALSGLGGYRFEVLATFALLLIAGFAGLALVPYYAPLLGRFSATRWIAGFVSSSHRVLIASSAAPSIFVIALFVHLLTIMSIWSLGQAFMLNLSTIDSAVLFTLIVGIGIAPITIGGWGLREVAVTAFLNAQGIPSQEALLFSVCFGLVLVVASLPGAIALLVFSPEGRSRQHDAYELTVSIRVARRIRCARPIRVAAGAVFNSTKLFFQLEVNHRPERPVEQPVRRLRYQPRDRQEPPGKKVHFLRLDLKSHGAELARPLVRFLCQSNRIVLAVILTNKVLHISRFTSHVSTRMPHGESPHYGLRDRKNQPRVQHSQSVERDLCPAAWLEHAIAFGKGPLWTDGMVQHT